MRDLNTLNRYRAHNMEMTLYGQPGNAENGIFLIPSAADGADLRVLATSGAGWDHVSISRGDRCPTWEEMEQVAALCFKDNEAAMQLHVPAIDHVNYHKFCLHWWRPLDTKLHRPPSWMVGPGNR